jgi:hypothetical protein
MSLLYVSAILIACAQVGLFARFASKWNILPRKSIERRTLIVLLILLVPAFAFTQILMGQSLGLSSHEAHVTIRVIVVLQNVVSIAVAIALAMRGKRDSGTNH